MRRLFHLVFLCAVALPVLLSAQTQSRDAALLVADQVLVEDQNRLIATGNVEALYDGNRLTAARIAYDRTTDRLTIDGPVRITTTDGIVLVADGADLDRSLENGLLRGARMVLDAQLQLASVEARRVGGRYTQLSKVAITSCQVCGTGRAPLWQIRARRVVHDQEERQLYFDGAQLRILDVPVFYIPRLRLPDPTLARAQGFLIPELRSSTLLGFGIKTPYFIPLGDHADLTLTPYLSTVTRTLEYRIRRAFRTGDLEIKGAFGEDTVLSGQTRGYLFAEGGFALPQDYRLTFNIQAVSDPSYLSDYDVDDTDRLESALTVERVRRDRYFGASLLHYESLRDTEDNATQPTIVTDLRQEQRWFPRWGGELRLNTIAHAHYRYSDLDIDGPDADSEIDGRDVTRLNLGLAYLNRWTLTGGIRMGVTAQVLADAYRIRQDSTMDPSSTALTSSAAVELRWPWVRSEGSGARNLIEPVAQLGWTGGTRKAVPNDESTRVEFDEGNLLALSRFPAVDRRERGLVGTVGLRWLHQAPSGLSSSLTLGRVWRDTVDGDFSDSSGLSGDTSDWLIAGHVDLANGLGFTARGILDSDLDIAKAEARGAWTTDRWGINATYVLLAADAQEDRAAALSEWNFAGTYNLTRFWTASASWRYDLEADALARSRLRLDYRNECVEVGFSVSRRFATSTNVEPSTNFGLTVALKGFSTGGSAKEYRRTCS